MDAAVSSIAALPPAPRWATPPWCAAPRTSAAFPRAAAKETAEISPTGAAPRFHCGGCDTAKGETCGGAGAANICGVCAPKTTCPTGWMCGTSPAGCGLAAIACGTCDAATETCTTNHTCCKKTTCAAEERAAAPVSTGAVVSWYAATLGLAPIRRIKLA